MRTATPPLLRQTTRPQSQLAALSCSLALRAATAARLRGCCRRPPGPALGTRAMSTDRWWRGATRRWFWTTTRTRTWRSRWRRRSGLVPRHYGSRGTRACAYERPDFGCTDPGQWVMCACFACRSPRRQSTYVAVHCRGRPARSSRVCWQPILCQLCRGALSIAGPLEGRSTAFASRVRRRWCGSSVARVRVHDDGGRGGRVGHGTWCSSVLAHGRSGQLRLAVWDGRCGRAAARPGR